MGDEHDQLERRVAGLEARLARMDAVERARALLYQYGAGCDARRPEAVVATFDDAAVLQAGARRLEGREAIAAFYAQALDRERRHFLTNIALEADTDGIVTGTSMLLVVEPGSPQPIHWGHYTDRIRVDAAGARFVHRTIVIEGGLPFAASESGT